MNLFSDTRTLNPWGSWKLHNPTNSVELFLVLYSYKIQNWKQVSYYKTWSYSKTILTDNPVQTIKMTKYGGMPKAKNLLKFRQQFTIIFCLLTIYNNNEILKVKDKKTNSTHCPSFVILQKV